MRKPCLRSFRLAAFLAFCFVFLHQKSRAQPEIPALSGAAHVNSFSGHWLIYEEDSKKLVPYIAQEHSDQRAFYQHLNIRPDQPFEISFPADRGLCLFLNNRLIFTADSAASYTLDLTSQVLLPAGKKVLLTVWSPGAAPDLEAFKAVPEIRKPGISATGKKLPEMKVKPVSNQSAFTVFLLLIGLIYGALRTNFTSDFNSVLRMGNLFHSTAPEEGFLAKPVASWPGILFVLAFALGFSVLVVAIRISGLNTFIFNRFFRFSDTDIITRIIFSTAIVFGVVLLRYLFLNIVAYIFNLSEIVGLQYREFLRGVLFIGLILPAIILFYLIFYQVYPGLVYGGTALLLVILLTVIVLRVILLVNKKESLLNLHLFSYICATEIIPLTVVLKLILFNT